MYSESDLEAAVTAGALTPDQATRFRDFVADSRHMPVVDEEHFRLLTGFNDIFVGIAAAILLVALAWIGYYIPPNIQGEGPSPFMGVLVAGAAWGLAEFFTRQRRMALPSIILLFAFVGGILGAVGFTTILAIGTDAIEANEWNLVGIAAFSAAIAALGAWLHWKRFRVPITVAVGAATLVGVVLLTLAWIVGDVPALEDILLGAGLVLGLGVFLLAMWWDSSDPQRRTRRSDTAFWLHLLAAPMIVHPIFTLLGLNDGEASAMEGVVVILLYVVLGLAALAIDRRAMLVSALAYVLWALSDLFERFGAVELNYALTALVIGSGLLLLSAFWTNARRAVVRPLPEGLRIRLPAIDRVPNAASIAA